MPATTGIAPSLATVAIAKKAVVPLSVASRPPSGQLWPRGSKAAGN